MKFLRKLMEKFERETDTDLSFEEGKIVKRRWFSSEKKRKDRRSSIKERYKSKHVVIHRIAYGRETPEGPIFVSMYFANKDDLDRPRYSLYVIHPLASKHIWLMRDGDEVYFEYLENYKGSHRAISGLRNYTLEKEFGGPSNSER